MTAPKLTEAQCRALRRIAQAGLSAESWPSAQMMATIIQHGWAHDDGTGISLTDAGRAALRGES